MTNLKQKLAELQVEVKALQKQIADAESYYPKVGDDGYVLWAGDKIIKGQWSGSRYDHAYFDQGNWFATEREAELTRDYRAAVTRINRAIREGARGDANPWLGWDGTWSWGMNTKFLFRRGSIASIKAILKSHADDFEAVRKYIEEVLK